MSSSDLKLALKITTDLNSAKEELQGFNNELENIATTTKASSESWREYAAEYGRRSIAKDAQAVTAVFDEQRVSVKALIEQIDPLEKKFARLDDLTEQLQQKFNDGHIAESEYDAALSKISTQRGLLDSAAIESQRTALSNLLGEIDPLEKKLFRFIELEEQLKKAFESGEIGVERYEGALAKLNEKAGKIYATAESNNIAPLEKQRIAVNKLLASLDPLEKKVQKLDKAQEELNQAHKSGVIDTETYNTAIKKLNAQRDITVNGQTKLTRSTKTSNRELSILARQLSTGSFGSASSGLLSLTERAGILPSVFSGAGLAMGGFIGVGALLAKTVTDINNEQTLLNRSIQQTGNYSGITTGQLAGMARGLQSAQTTITDSKAIITGLNSTGQFTAKTLESVGSAAVAMSELTGKSASESISHFSRMSNGVTAWANETNKQYHFLDLATAQRIQTLEHQGRTEEAIELASQRFTEAATQRIAEMRQELNWLQAAWEGTKGISQDVSTSFVRDTKAFYVLKVKMKKLPG